VLGADGAAPPTCPGSHALVSLASAGSLGGSDPHGRPHVAAPGAMLPPSVICAFLAQQRGSASSDTSSGGSAHDDDRGGGGGAKQLHRKSSGRSGGARHAARHGGGGHGVGFKRAVSRLLRRTFVAAAAAGLVAGGAAIGRLLHANYMATLDDRDALVGGSPARGQASRRVGQDAGGTDCRGDACEEGRMQAARWGGSGAEDARGGAAVAPKHWARPRGGQT
jgi:hypothetical protein